MDRAASWEKHIEPPLVDFVTHEANYICHSDGGTRAGSCSAAGWVIEAVVTRDSQTVLFPVLMKGIYIKDPISSFLAEAIALEDVVSSMASHLGRFSV